MGEILEGTMPATLVIQSNAPVPTWFRVGGSADRLVRPTTLEQLAECVRMDPELKVLGDGANLLVDDDGVAELVVELSEPYFRRIELDAARGSAVVGAGANLPKLINACVREGLSGLEGLGGIPATIGGAAIMNAGGAFGQFSDTVVRVHALDRHARQLVLERSSIAYSYRHSGLDDLLITAVELRLIQADPRQLRARHLEVMEYKKRTQPMAENSAGCCFKNPMLGLDLEQIGARGQRVSAGMLIDKAGCLGLTSGGAEVSRVHGNFLTAGRGARARDVIDLMKEVERRVYDRFGVRLEREVVVWERTP